MGGAFVGRGRGFKVASHRRAAARLRVYNYVRYTVVLSKEDHARFAEQASR
jgi:hypothetical protein